MVTNIDNNGPGSLREAITSANSNRNGTANAFDNGTGVVDIIEIRLPPTEPNETEPVAGTILLTSPLPNISEALTIDGGGVITLDAGNGLDGEFGTGDGFRLFDVDDRSSVSVEEIDVTLMGLTLTGGDNERNAGNFTQPGGAIRNRENLTLINVHIIGNSAGDGGSEFSEGGDGGGIFNLGAPLTLIDSSVTGNRAGDGGRTGPTTGDARGGIGGGIVSTNPGVCTLIRSTVSGNTAGAGGLSDGDVETGGRGGGIHNSNVLVIMDSTISGNTTQGDSAGGGAIASRGFNSGNGRVTIFNSTIFGNSAPDDVGGAIDSGSSDTVTIINSIIAGNTAGLGRF